MLFIVVKLKCLVFVFVVFYNIIMEKVCIIIDEGDYYLVLRKLNILGIDFDKFTYF